MINSRKENRLPLVSVIIPSFNGAEFIKETIDSVLNQSFQNFEMIITDDASTDHTKEIIRDYRTDSRISFFQNNERLGIGGNWNHGIEKSHGKYIKILCQDDIIKPHYLEKVVEILENDSSISLVTTFEQFFGDSDRIRNEKDIPFKERAEGAKVQNHVLKKGNWIGGPTAVTFRRKDLSVGMFDTSLECGLDYEMWLRLLGEGDLYVVPEILFQSRIHKHQATSGCIRYLGFEKDRIRILNKMKEKPEIYGGIDSDILQEATEQSIRVFVDRSLKHNLINKTDIFQFLHQHIGFPRSITSMVRGMVVKSLASFK